MMNRSGRNFLLVGLGLMLCLLVGCTAPTSRVTLRYSLPPSGQVEKFDANYPAVQEAMEIINSVLHRHGYQPDWNSDRFLGAGWRIETNYKKKGDLASVVNTGGTAGKFRINIVFDSAFRFYVNQKPEVLRVWNEMGQELVRKFGKERVSMSNTKERILVN